MAECHVCFHHCKLSEGKRGRCLARICRDGAVVPANYGMVTALALDPIEKKPLSGFFPGSMILSVGSYGCNLSCRFCQNHEIAHPPVGVDYTPAVGMREMTPEELVSAAKRAQRDGNIGLAFTYNEPLVGYEFVRDTAKRIKEAGMRTVLVTNGTAELPVLEELLPWIDAMNIDLKGFTERFYTEMAGGSLAMTKAFLEKAAAHCHVEVTTLIIPGENDTESEMEALTDYLAGLNGGAGKEIPLHITRFFPRYHLTDRGPTPVETVYRLCETARKKMTYVYAGNV
ncbi:MAG: AmmeMemoRadiSam system radical SAM enzyme [Lachnospiraceae bacterium]|nr:AmmeMemoRadiSam system radical SAM enzyme [Lachnospiraceae bacterium]